MFVVTGHHYTSAAADAARSVAETNPWLKIGIFSDQDIADPIFHFVGKIEGDDSRRKHEYVSQSPFANTLYLDSDVRVVGDLRDLFQLLERYEIAGAQVRYRSSPRRLGKHQLDIPQAFPQINCGVLLYRKCSAVDALFQSWADLYREGGFTRDQIPFREALWRTQVKFYAVAPEYNMRSIPLLPSKNPLPVILHINALHSPSWLRRFWANMLLAPVRARLRRFAKYGPRPVKPAPR
ncbi:MAG TPA: hypothetical protein VM144_03370 [Aestuariivirga sp.]|nr:hypothetical protein [Aestuariivirga sp.]